MKQLFCQMASYNLWAHQRITHALLEMDEACWTREVNSSFGSLYKTLLHLWDAESIWWQRMRLHQQLIVPSTNFQPTMKDACNGLLQQSLQWDEFVRDVLDDAAINSKLVYKNSSGVQFFQPVYEVLMHVFNHASYHRGQLITLMRQQGADSVPQTDFIMYCRTAS